MNREKTLKRENARKKSRREEEKGTKILKY